MGVGWGLPGQDVRVTPPPSQLWGPICWRDSEKRVTELSQPQWPTVDLPNIFLIFHTAEILPLQAGFLKECGKKNLCNIH